MPSILLPVSLGGNASFGADGQCCIGVSHRSFLHSDQQGLGADLLLLESFVGVGPHEVEAVKRLRRELVGESQLRSQPAHVVGSVALLRIVRDNEPSMELAKRMFETRAGLNSSAVHREILDGGLTLSTLPGTAELHAASWQTNEWLATDKHGDVVVYERWGAVDPSRFMAEFTLEQYAQWSVYRWEARSMVLDQLSRRAGKVVRFVNVLNVKGATFESRKLIRTYFAEFSGGDAVHSVPPLNSKTFIVSLHTIPIALT